MARSTGSNTFDPAKTPGVAGAVPPAHAPQETTLAGSERPTADQIRMARANEQPEPVYAPPPMSDEQAAAFLGKSVDYIKAQRAAEQAKVLPKPVAPALVGPDGQPISGKGDTAPVPAAALKPATSVRRAGQARPSVDIQAPSTPAPVPQARDAAEYPNKAEDTAPVITAAVEPVALEVPTLAAVAQQLHPHTGIPSNEPYRPAASDTDSPSRGIPAALPKGKEITGGFGDVGEAQYYGLNGTEVLALINAQLDALRARIQDDLRFSIAAVYPRLNARVVIEIDCYAQDTGFQIERKLVPPHTRTPIDIARQHADHCVFCIIEEHIEMLDDGTSVTPPNKARLDLGLDVPRKHAVKLPNQQTMMVDI